MFDWDDANLEHIAEHGVSASEAEQVILNDPIDLDFELRSGEERFRHVGQTNGGRLLVVVSTWRRDGIRGITAYPPSKVLKRLYLAQKGSAYGKEVHDP